MTDSNHAKNHHDFRLCQGKPAARPEPGDRWVCDDCGREWEARVIWMTVPTEAERAAHERWAADPFGLKQPITEANEVVQIAKGMKGLQVITPTPCREHGLCTLCGQPSALTRGRRIKDSAKAWTLAFDWIRIRVCRECMVILGNVLHDEVLTYDER